MQAAGIVISPQPCFSIPARFDPVKYGRSVEVSRQQQRHGSTTRGANPRVQKYVHWLALAQLDKTNPAKLAERATALAS